MVLYRIALFPLAKELRAADPGILFPFYADDAAFDGCPVWVQRAEPLGNAIECVASLSSGGKV